MASRLPQVALTGGYTHFDNQILDRRNFSMVGVGFTWSLFDGGVARNESESLRSESRSITLEVQATNNHDNAVLDEGLAGIELAYAVGAL
jgi:outer membrane protein TolC